MYLVILNQFKIVKNKLSLYLIDLGKMTYCVFSDAKRNLTSLLSACD